MNWIQNLSFSDLVLALSTFITLIAGYLNLNYKLDSAIKKIEEADKTQEKFSVDMTLLENSNKQDIININRSFDSRFFAIEERLRATDVFIGRFDEKMNYLVEQVKQLVDRKNDK